MLYPARGRENLFMLFLRHGHDARLFVKDHETRAGRALIDRTDITLHLGSTLHVARAQKM